MTSYVRTTIGGPALSLRPALEVTKDLTLAANTTCARGEVMEIDGTTGAVKTLTAEANASVIALDDYETGGSAENKKFYVAGVFNREALTLPDGLTDMDAVDSAFLSGGRIIVL